MLTDLLKKLNPLKLPWWVQVALFTLGATAILAARNVLQ